MMTAIRLRIFVGLFFAALVLTACGDNPVREHADDQLKSLDQLIYGKARESFLAGKYGTALTLFEPLASKGNAKAQYTLGYLHYNGLGTKKDLASAMQWFEKSAAQNNLNAMTAISKIQTATAQLEKDSADEAIASQAAIDLRSLNLKPSIERIPAEKLNPVEVTTLPPVDSTEQETTAYIAPSSALKMILPEPGVNNIKLTTKPSASVDDAFIPPTQEQSSEWILKQPNEYYTIQLASSPRIILILDFIKKTPLDGVYFFGHQRNGSTRYNIIHGSFQTYDQATAKLQRLHNRGFKNAWIRNMEQVQKLITSTSGS